MAGFLERLAARTLGTVAAAKPLVQVSFAPAQAAPEPAPENPQRILTQAPQVERHIEISTTPEVIHHSSKESLLAREVVSSDVVRVERATERTVVERGIAPPPIPPPIPSMPVAIPRVEPRLTPASSAVRQTKPAVNQAAPGPVVRVSIGRIDVRAEIAPAAAARVPARTPAPALSLEAYRRQRDGGLR